MKQLTCEMCGSNDLIKQDGVFVCQSCGCKYSVEEAKKMMVEGTVDVSGSIIKLDSSDKLKNLYTLARRARDDKNMQDAAKYYHEIQIEDPDSWEAAFYGVYFTALNCKIGEIEVAAHSISNSIASISSLIQNNLPKDEQKEAYTEMLLKTWQAGEMLFNASKETFTSNSYNGALSDFTDRAVACITTMIAAGLSAETIFNDYPLAEIFYRNTINVCSSSPVTQDYSKVCKDKLNEIKPKLQAEQNKKIDEYWQKHAEEKRKYETRIAEINAEIKHLQEILKTYDFKIAEIKKELSHKIPAEIQLETMRAQQSDLNNKKRNLGLFSGKQKKQLQEQIDELTVQINSIQKMIKVKRDELHKEVASKIDSIKAEMKPYTDKIAELEKEKNSIINELKKPR